MLAKFPGTCRYCKKPIEVGRDTYDIESKTNWHEVCRENQPPSPEAYKLADKLGYLDHERAMGTDGDLFLLQDELRGASAGRLESPARGEQSGLFGV